MRIAWNGAFLYFNASGHALQTSEETLYTSTIMAYLVTLSTHTILQAGHLVAFSQLFSEAVRADQSVVQTQHPAPFSLAQSIPSALPPSRSPFEDPGLHGALFQFLRPQKVPIFFQGPHFLYFRLKNAL